MLADDCWLEVVRYQNRYSLDVLSLVSVASQKKILTDKCIASFRRTLVNVSYRNDDWFMEGPDGRTLTFIDIHHASFQERQASGKRYSNCNCFSSRSVFFAKKGVIFPCRSLKMVPLEQCVNCSLRTVVETREKTRTRKRTVVHWTMPPRTIRGS